MIVDDEPAARRTLRECCASEPDLRLVGEFGDGTSALAAIKQHPPDVLFLDIQMEFMSGMQLARAVSKCGQPSLVVFVTAYDEYAVQAFELNATDYLLKPFNRKRFGATLTRVRNRLAAQHATDRQRSLTAVLEQLERGAFTTSEARPRMLVDAGGRMQMVDVAQVEVVEADRNYITLRVSKEALHARCTLQQAEDAMRSQPLMRISRSCFVNITHVREVHKTPRGDYILVLSGGTTVSSSEGYREKVRARLDALIVGGHRGG